MDLHGRTYSIKGERAMSQGFIAQYAANAAAHTEGVHSLNTGIVTSLKVAIGLEHEGNGVRVAFRGENSDDVIITVYIDVRFGFVMPEVAWAVQERVKKDVERYTGLNVTAVNVNIMRVLADEVEGDSRDPVLGNSDKFDAGETAGHIEDISADAAESADNAGEAENATGEVYT